MRTRRPPTIIKDGNFTGLAVALSVSCLVSVAIFVVIFGRLLSEKCRQLLGLPVRREQQDW